MVDVDIKKDWKGLAELIAITRVVMQDMKAPQSDIIEMENGMLKNFGITRSSTLGRMVIAWSRSCPTDESDEDEDE